VNQPNTIIHIGAVNVHTSSPGQLLQADGFLTAEYASCREALRTAIAPPDTVLDYATGLMWSKATTAKGKTWAEAKEAAAAVRLGGYTDWRLPTRAELLTLVDDTRSNPAIDTARFDCDPDWYWSSTPLASSPSDYAWVVDFYGGYADCLHQFNLGRVRAVRSVSPASPGQ
jgi:hypothetical protein